MARRLCEWVVVLPIAGCAGRTAGDGSVDAGEEPAAEASVQCPSAEESYCPASPSCSSSQSRCSGYCALLDDDPRNCGACGRSCASTEICVLGRCGPAGCGTDAMCPSGEVFTCPDFTSDAANCGGCGNVCSSGDACRVSHCHAPTDPTWRAAVEPEGTWIDACAAPGSQTVLPFSTAGVAPEPMPFEFRFWGVPVPMGTLVDVTPSGFVTLEAASGAGGSILAFEGVNTRAGGVCVATVGAPPDRQFVVEWVDADDLQSDVTATYHLTFEIVLAETTSNIDFVYHTVVEEGYPLFPDVGILKTDNSDAVGLCHAAMTLSDQSVCPRQGTRIHLTPVN